MAFVLREAESWPRHLSSPPRAGPNIDPPVNLHLFPQGCEEIDQIRELAAFSALASDIAPGPQPSSLQD
jgi:hypothetical protein